MSLDGSGVLYVVELYLPLPLRITRAWIAESVCVSVDDNKVCVVVMFKL
jgi:hypothetical protein